MNIKRDKLKLVNGVNPRYVVCVLCGGEGKTPAGVKYGSGYYPVSQTVIYEGKRLCPMHYRWYRVESLRKGDAGLIIDDLTPIK